MAFQPGDEVTIGNQVRVHIVDHESYLPDVVRTKCGKLGFAYEPPPWFHHDYCHRCKHA